MNSKKRYRRLLSCSIAAIQTAAVVSMTALPASAQPSYITGLFAAAGDKALESIEENGYSPILTGLNMGSTGGEQVYIGYTKDGSDPITDVRLMADCGDSTVIDGISYSCAAHVDLDAGKESSAGCLYITHDPQAGTPIVALDIRRAVVADEGVLMPIANDGSEVVCDENHYPRSAENDETAMIYLYMIRDQIAAPYIRDMAVVTADSHWEAVAQAAAQGFRYYADVNLNPEQSDVSIIAYQRTQDREQAVTHIVAVKPEAFSAGEYDVPPEETAEPEVPDAAQEEQTEETEETLPPETAAVQHLTLEQDAADSGTIRISGREYVRLPGQQEHSEYFLYATKDATAGNPIYMLYGGDSDGTAKTLLGTWANAFFTMGSSTGAGSYVTYQEGFEALCSDMTVCVQTPVLLIGNGEHGQELQKLPLYAMTAEDALPPEVLHPAGLADSGDETPVMEHLDGVQEKRQNASVFGENSKAGLWIAGGGVFTMCAAAVYLILRKKRKQHKD